MKLDVLDRGAELVQRYRPRVEGSFACIERHTEKASRAVHWEVTTKDNVTHVYGRSAASQVVDPKDAQRVFTWLLEERWRSSERAVTRLQRPGYTSIAEAVALL